MRRLLSSGVAVAAALALVAPVLQAAPAHAATATTVVLSFDGTLVTGATVVAPLLDAHGMKATFYVNSSLVGSDSAHLGWTDLANLQTDGQEIGGHAVDMTDLTTIPTEDVETEVCQDRADLVNHGLHITDFAYPHGFGYATASVRSVIAACGYNSARRAWGLFSTHPECINNNGCNYPPAGANPPADPYGIPTADIVQSDTTLEQLEATVTRAEDSGGGLVPIIFQEICDACDKYSTTQATLSAFLDWLQPRAATGTVVETMRDVIGGAEQPLDTTPPTSTIECDNAPCTTDWYGSSMRVSLPATDDRSGVSSVRYTTDGTDPSRTSTKYTAPFALPSSVTVKFRAYDVAGNVEAVNSQFINVDSVAPSTTIECDAAPCSNGWSHSAETISLAATDTGGSGLSVVHYTTDGSTPTLTSRTYSAPFIAANTETVRYRAWDVAGNAEATKSQLVDIDTIAPTTGIKCNNRVCSAAGWYRGSVRVTLTAADTGGSGLAAIHYTTNGSTPTIASPLYTVPLTLRSTKSVKILSVDNAGLSSAVRTTVVRVDATRPTITLTAPKNHAFVKGRVNVNARVSDAQSGIARVLFYVDRKLVFTDTRAGYGFVWNTSKLSKRSHTLTAKAIDRAGNIRAVSITVVVR
jgi:peptidoglycan/xylan/chitin deacetylase (PgdA/CDA1 family)